VGIKFDTRWKALGQIPFNSEPVIVTNVIVAMLNLRVLDMRPLTNEGIVTHPVCDDPCDGRHESEGDVFPIWTGLNHEAHFVGLCIRSTFAISIHSNDKENPVMPIGQGPTNGAFSRELVRK
jgi:hypothetical protein